jgi:predicted HicB family RNase H-like nuclease
VPARRSTNFNLRLDPKELRAWRRAAKQADVPLAQWIRQRCNTSLRDLGPQLTEMIR